MVDGVNAPNRSLATSLRRVKPNRLHRHVRRHAAGLNIEKKEAGVSGAARRLLGHRIKAWPTAWLEAFAERMHERVRKGILGAMGPMKAGQRRADQGTVPRHSPGAWLPSLPRPQCEREMFRVLDARHPHAPD